MSKYFDMLIEKFIIKFDFVTNFLTWIAKLRTLLQINFSDFFDNH